MSEARQFSYSRILDYATCPRKYYWRNVRRIVPVEKHKALSFGYCMSEALRAWRRSSSVEDAKEAFVAAWVSDGKILKQEFDPDDPKDFRTVHRGFDLIKEYTSQYPDEPSQVIQSEVKFDGVSLGIVDGVAIQARGRIDGVLMIGNDINVLEDKTTSALGPSFFKTIKSSLQVSLYLWISDQLGLFKIGDKSTTPRCIINAMRVHPKEFKFDRDIVLKSRSKLNLIQENLLDWVKQIFWSEKTGIYPMNDIDGSICEKYNGCEYLPLRYATKSMQDTLIESSFKPLEHHEPKEEETI